MNRMMMKRVAEVIAKAPARPLSTAFESLGSKTFTDATLKAAVSEATYNEFKAGNVSGAPLSDGAKKELATAIKNWALEHGCVNFAHFFQPMRVSDARSQAAYKMDGFVDLDFGDPATLKPVVGEAFGADRLFQSETDGSSFPNGGLRITHRAAAFMSWDKSSSPYIIGDTVFIPSAFVTHNGEALDHKTPLLRAQQAINTQGLRLLRHLGDSDAQQVVANVGWEQEYFLIPRDMYIQRPDLVSCGRTLFGAHSPRNQEGCEQYFGVPYPQAKAYMEEVTQALWDLNIALSVNHNEVAPSQHENSPIFSLTNVASDQNMITMEVMDQIAARHNLKVLWHEKPFAGINGSGKHSNWGLNTDTGKNLFKPGKTETTQGDFFAFTAALAYTINHHGDVLRCAVTGAGNDHRLGAQEAPPAIVSLYTGDIMEAHIKNIIAGGPLFGYNAAGDQLPFGSNSVEAATRGAEDRNRTAPFPFCGNRFEFRAVGSSQNVSQPMAYLNAAMADGISALCEKIEGGTAPRDAVAEMYSENMRAIFNGNGYSAEWAAEAEQRGLLNLPNTPVALSHFASDKNKKLFTSTGVFTEAEVEARQEIMLDEYSNILLIEAETALRMANQNYLPVLAEDLKSYAGTDLAGDRQSVYAAVATETKALAAAVAGINEDASPQAKADYMAGTVKPQMLNLRAAVDAAELLCDHDKWPMPSYQEMTQGHHSADAGYGAF